MKMFLIFCLCFFVGCQYEFRQYQPINENTVFVTSLVSVRYAGQSVVDTLRFRHPKDYEFRLGERGNTDVFCLYLGPNIVAQGVVSFAELETK